MLEAQPLQAAGVVLQNHLGDQLVPEGAVDASAVRAAVIGQQLDGDALGARRSRLADSAFDHDVLGAVLLHFEGLLIDEVRLESAVVADRRDSDLGGLGADERIGRVGLADFQPELYDGYSSVRRIGDDEVGRAQGLQEVAAVVVVAGVGGSGARGHADGQGAVSFALVVVLHRKRSSGIGGSRDGAEAVLRRKGCRVRVRVRVGALHRRSLDGFNSPDLLELAATQFETNYFLSGAVVLSALHFHLDACDLAVLHQPMRLLEPLLVGVDISLGLAVNQGACDGNVFHYIFSDFS